MSKTMKRVLLYGGVALLVLVVAGAFFVRRLESAALALAETGTGNIQLLNEFAGGVKGLELDAVAATYAPEYNGAIGGTWVERLESERDGVRIYRWEDASTDGGAAAGMSSAHADDPATDATAPAGATDAGDGAPTDANGTAVGSAGMHGAVRPADDTRWDLGSYLDTLQSVHQAKFKLARVEQILSDSEAVIRSVLWLRGIKHSGELFESHTRYRLSVRKIDGSWRIVGQEFLGGDAVTGRGEGFANITSEAGLDFQSRHNPLWYTPEWHPETFGIIKYGPGGVSTADYDNDGWYDLLFADTSQLALYRNNGGGFENVTTAAGLPADALGASVGIFADLDNDGDKDLFIGRFTADNMLFRNNGDGTFTDVTEGAGLGGYFVTVGASADYDGDGLLDLYAGRYLDPRTKNPTTMFYTRNGAGNSLLRNTGDLRFEDVTERAGVRDGGLTLGVVWADYDEDGDQDLYVANDFGRNALFANNGDGTFEDVAPASDAIDFGFGMSADFGDVDNDGDLDIYTANVHSGQRWYGQAATLYQYLITSVRLGTIRQDFSTYWDAFGYLGPDWYSIGDHMVKGNSLLLNDGSGNYEEATEEANTNPYGWYWGSLFADFDNDGLQDIYSANGWITGRVYDDF